MNTEHPTPDAEGGFVPRLDADPSTARYELLTAAQAVERVAAVGFDRADAARMVGQYLDRNTAAMGAPPGDGWRIDPFDLAEIARGYDWVDHYQGETIADAQTRAAGYASDLQRRADAVDRIEDPGYAARLDREADLWAARAGAGYTPWASLEPEVVRGLVPPSTGHAPAVEEQDEQRTPEQDARSQVVVAASWALAARDCAIENGDPEPAARFASQAREALAAAEAAGITREQLAAELDYPGGAVELDGEHVEVGIDSGTPCTAAQLAVLDAAWDEAMAVSPPADPADVWGAIDGDTDGDGDVDGDADGDGDGDGGVRGPVDPGPLPLSPGDGADTHDTDTGRDDRAGGLGEPRAGDRAHDGTGSGEAPAVVAWWEPIDPEFTLTQDEVVSELTHRGMTAGQAAGAVTRYLEETSREIGIPVHQWCMEAHDIDAITHAHAAVLTDRPESDPWAQATGPDLTAAVQVGSDREDGGPASDGRGPDLPGNAPAAAVHRPDLDAIAAERRVAAARDAVAQATAPTRTSRQAEGDAEQDRRVQLAAWAHDDDTSTDGAEHGMELQR